MIFEKTLILFRLNIIIIAWLLIFKILVAQDSLYLFTEFHGENDQDQFGVVENVGDVNGDGYEDLIVGAPAYLPFTESDGYAKLYLGGADFDTIADLEFRIYDNQIISFGRTIAGNGDLNGDGYSDFAIADPNYGDFNVGKVYIYFGGSELDTIPELILTLNPAQYFHTQFGFSMSMSGDINDDGYDDLVVGAPLDDWDRHGEVFIYFGGSAMDNAVDVNIINEVDYLRFGYTLDYIGDANNDNIDDLLVGSLPSESSNDQGFIFWGSSTNDIGFNNSYVFVDTAYHAAIARSVSKLGDINNDGFDDFALLSSDSIIICLSPLTNGEFDKRVFRRNEDMGSFYSVHGCSDINDDGYDEILIGTNYTNTINCKVIIIFGDENASLNNTLLIENEDFKFGFGYHIASFDSLIRNDVITLAIGYLETQFYEDHGTGKVFIYNNDDLLGIDEPENLININDFKLFQNYPNPFNPITTIKFRTQVLSNVELQLFDLLGNEVSTILSTIKPAGTYYQKVNFDNYSITSGIYFVRMRALPRHNPEKVVQKTIKLILIK